METQRKRASFNMIQQQVRPWDVLDDRVLDVMSALPRESFVPAAYQGLAYADIEVPLGGDRAMLAPKVVGRMLQALDVQPGDKVLEVGSGTGYTTALLSRLGGRVIGTESDPDLAAGARERLAALGLGRADILESDGLVVSTAGAPFEVIAVSGSVPSEQSVRLLKNQLAVGGRLFCVVGVDPVMEACLITRVGARDFRREVLFETCCPSLVRDTQPEGFVF